MSENPKRTAAKLRRQIASSIAEVGNIQSTARNAKSNPSEYLALLKGMIPSLDNYYKKYEDAYDELILLNDDLADLNFPNDEEKKNRSIMRNAFYEVKTIFISLTEPPSPSHNSTTLGNLNDSTTIVHESSSHLPDIRLEKFDGDILQWPKWRDAFRSIVDEHKFLSPAKKFHFLRSSLSGPALALISKFQLTEANYPLAWKALEDSYDKKRLLATAYLNRVLNFPPLQCKPNLESLKSFTTHVSDSISSFELLGIENESKFILFHLAFRLLDPGTREQFQNSHKDIEFPCFDDLSTFIKDKCFTMQLASDTNLMFDSYPTSKQHQNSGKPKNKFSKQNKSFGSSSFVANQSKVTSISQELPDSHSNVTCFICKESSHRLPSCKMFCTADVKQRIAWLKNWKGCRSCLSTNHTTGECKSKWCCRWCKQRHNSLICENDCGQTKSTTPNTSSGTCCTTSGTYAVTNESFHSQVLLGTCLADVLDAKGSYQTVRLVVDSASHFSFMTTKCAKRLGFVPNHCNVTVTGIGEACEGVKGFVRCLVKPVSKAAPHLTMKALLLKSITSHLPSVTLPRTLWNEYVKFPLADPTFFDSKPVDILLGADLFAELWLGSPIEVKSNSPKLFPTIFGHIVIGKFSENSSECRNKTSQGTSLIVTNRINLSDLNSNLQRFWEIEEPKPARKINPDDTYCEDHFTQTHYRLDDGSYGVRLPFRTNPPEFVGTESIALKRFRNQENRLAKNDKLRDKYDFMHKYISLGHMSVSTNPPAYVIPHHHVLKMDRNELKLRVVFDGSAQSQKSITIPRLELCGCLLLAKLYHSISEFVELLGSTNLISPLFFTDSTIVLGWLRTPTYKLKTFTCNRVSEILQITSEDQWHHVASHDNPADSGSRGYRPRELLESDLWWHGPAWLLQADSEWALPFLPDSLDLPDIKVEKPAMISVESPSPFHSQFIVEQIANFSSFNQLLRVLAYVLRFNHNLRHKNNRSSGSLKLLEIQRAKELCVKAVQLQHFFENDMSEKRQSKVMKNFVQLNPFFDSSGILRAGGRLYNSSLPYNHKHPILLPSDSHFTTIMIDHFHRTYLHPGPSLLQAVIQLEYWVPSLRRLLRKRVFSCNRCYRLKAKTFIPKMADLPPQRVQATFRAFMKTGLDYAGPFYMKESLRRKSAISKGYLCIFICMATKAIHIEVVSSLSADGFLAALDRFVSLRGHPTDLYSDCGSNFVSAARKLKEWFKWFTSEQTQQEIGEKITLRRINWHFNPPHATHFGGIWEAGVKSAKSLMTRTVGDVALTFEELVTLTAKISAILNSRPISPLPNDPSETNYLSPGHFLIGEAPLAIPEPTLLDVAINRLDRWQIVKRMSQHFWHRWHSEYLSTLQTRNKWKNATISLKVGDLVFVKDDNQPILHWARGRIIKLVPGGDGNVRVAHVKTATSKFTRPIAKLVPVFPPEIEEPITYIPSQEEKKRYQQWVRGLHPPEDSPVPRLSTSPTHQE